MLEPMRERNPKTFWEAGDKGIMSPVDLSIPKNGTYENLIALVDLKYIVRLNLINITERQEIIKQSRIIKSEEFLNRDEMDKRNKYFTKLRG